MAGTGGTISSSSLYCAAFECAGLCFGVGSLDVGIEEFKRDCILVFEFRVGALFMGCRISGDARPAGGATS
jgi:hypothetical protein